MPAFSTHGKPFCAKQVLFSPRVASWKNCRSEFLVIPKPGTKSKKQNLLLFQHNEIQKDVTNILNGKGVVNVAYFLTCAYIHACTLVYLCRHSDFQREESWRWNEHWRKKIELGFFGFFLFHWTSWVCCNMNLCYEATSLKAMLLLCGEGIVHQTAPFQTLPHQIW